MSLSELADPLTTDKNTTHSYLDLYQSILVSKKETAKNVLEIGVCLGGSIKLWNDFFINANVHGLDINMFESEFLKDEKRVILHTGIDAYNEYFFNSTLKNIKFDFMLDDGPHSLESMIQFIRLYSQIMTDDGVLIIEDVQAWEWIEILSNEVPLELKPFIKVYDLRETKNRYDDIVFTIDKTK